MDNNPQPRIKAYQQRNFSQKISATIDFLRHYARPYFKTHLHISLPAIVIISVLSIILYREILFFGNIDVDHMRTASNLLWNVLGLIVFSLAFIILITLTHFCFFKLWQEREGKAPSPREVWQLVRHFSGRATLLYLLTLLVSFLGFFLLVIPGIYLVITLSLAIPVMVHEDKGVNASFSRCFDLIKDKWWSTFGLLLVIGILGSLVGGLIQLPVTLYILIDQLLFIQETGEPKGYGPLVMGLSAVLGYLANVVQYAIVYTGLAFQYYNLVERKESHGLLQEIENIEGGVESASGDTDTESQEDDHR